MKYTVAVNNLWEQYDCLGRTFLVQHSTTPFELGTDVVTKGPNYRDWRWRLAHDVQCTTTLTGTKYKAVVRPYAMRGFARANPLFSCTINDNWTVGEYYRQTPLVSFIGPLSNATSLAKADTLALARFVSKLRSAEATFQGGVFLGELAETVHLLVSPAKSLQKGLSAYLGTLKKRRRQVRRVSPRKRLKAASTILADTWLEYAFGWRPLVSDINDAAKLLVSQSLHEHPRSKHILAFGRDEVFAGSSPQFCSGGIGVVTATRRDYAKKEVIYRASVSLDNPVRSGWRMAGFSPDQFVPTVWELIPYSFLVDYFTNIGDIISAATYCSENVKWMSRTTVDYLSTEIDGGQAAPRVFANLYAVQAAVAQAGYGKFEKTVVSRAPYTGSLVPPLYFSIPGFGTKWINMAALAVGQRALVPFHR